MGEAFVALSWLPSPGRTGPVTNVDEPVQPQPLSPAPEPKSITEWLTDARSILGVLGLLLFVVLRMAYSRFYGELGLSPDDLGLGYIDLLVPVRGRRGRVARR